MARKRKDPYLTTAEVAERMGWSSVAAVRIAVLRGYLPPADDAAGDPQLPANRRSKRWLTSTIETAIAHRPGQGARTDLKASA
jgi:hypothetical protein